MSFVHRPLDRQNNVIRLIRFVAPVKDHIEVALELIHTSIDENIQFAAVSYVWGDPKDTTEIQINGQSSQIGCNLWAGLYQLRQNGIHTWLWADAICINQSNLEEKNWQVSMMRDIFSRAGVVYMWLGRGSHESDKAMNFISRVGPQALALGARDLVPHHKHRQEIRDYIEVLATPQPAVASDEVLKPALAHFIYGLLHEKGLLARASPEEDLQFGIEDILCREYWHRIWIVQEVALAKEGVVMCGEKTVSLDVFDATCTAVWHCRRSGLFDILPETRTFGRGLNLNLYTTKAISARRQRRLGNELRLAKLLVDERAAPGRPFYSASDPRDICFGLLGVIDDGETLDLRVDYNKTVVEVFTEMTAAMLRDGDEKSGPFHLDWCVPKQGSLGPLPGWVPDWCHVGKYGFRVWPINYSNFFNASGGIRSRSAGTRSENYKHPIALTRLGCVVDVVTEVMQPPEWIQLDEWKLPMLANVDAWLSSVNSFANLAPKTGPAEDYLWRTVTLGKFSRGRYKSLGEENAYFLRRIMRREPIDPDFLTEDQIEFIHELYIRSSRKADSESLSAQVACVWQNLPRSIGTGWRGRTLFKTAKSMLGLGHIAVQPGDVVTLLWGLGSPCILRPRDIGENSRNFVFMGDAYVDGIMQGEFLRTKPAEETFTIF